VTGEECARGTHDVLECGDWFSVEYADTNIVDGPPRCRRDDACRRLPGE
jgi:hypothetical protein